MPRIIAGDNKGMILNAPKGDRTRPTTDKVKEAIFSIIQVRVPNASFLDLFAGSGQMGLEALSRGASKAVFVEKNRQSIYVIQENIAKAGRIQESEIVAGDVASALRRIADRNESFDIIFMDPPYKEAKKMLDIVADQVCKNSLLSEDGVLIIEHDSDDIFDETVINLTLSRRCKYGSTMLTFYQIL
ncbi:MAG: 16S rRNA (guanine(966)-N(2))-methyltransferase RsmD [Clostridiaceae bacterium]|mgnify:CR=1 FL=1|nr:16S rRNA (guanine(966)-N(2))-methyltransferase RsmD [Clostridiaceae bacterium]